jgi:hypothetical protein
MDEIAEALGSNDNCSRLSFDFGSLEPLPSTPRSSLLLSSLLTPKEENKPADLNLKKSKSENDLGSLSLADAMKMNIEYESAYLEPDSSCPKMNLSPQAKAQLQQPKVLKRERTQSMEKSVKLERKGSEKKLVMARSQSCTALSTMKRKAGKKALPTNKLKINTKGTVRPVMPVPPCGFPFSPFGRPMMNPSKLNSMQPPVLPKGINCKPFQIYPALFPRQFPFPKGMPMMPLGMGMPMMPLPFLSALPKPADTKNHRGGYKCGRCGQQKAGHDCPYKSKASDKEKTETEQEKTEQVKRQSKEAGEETQKKLREQREEKRVQWKDADADMVYGRCIAIQCDLSITTDATQAVDSPTSVITVVDV